MSISQLSAYYAGREPYLKYPNENRDITLSGLVNATEGLTVGGVATFNQAAIMNYSLQIVDVQAPNDFNTISTDVGGALFIIASKQTILPTIADANLEGLAIGWDVEAGSGNTDFINLSQGGGGGFVFKTFNTTGIYQSLFSLAPTTLPVFTYGPVGYGHMIATGSLAFAYPSTTTASINLASGVYAYSINIPGTWTSAQAANATIMTTICNTNVGLGAVTCAVIGMPSMISGFLNFQIQVINASHQAQECDFYYTANCGNY